MMRLGPISRLAFFWWRRGTVAGVAVTGHAGISGQAAARAPASQPGYVVRLHREAPGASRPLRTAAPQGLPHHRRQARQRAPPPPGTDST